MLICRIKAASAAVLFMAFGLAGCFQPLHGPQFGAIQPMLRAVEVTQMEGHFGHQLKSELDFLLNNGEPPASPQYRLSTTPVGSSGSVIVNVDSGRPQMMTYATTANYTLVSIADGKVLSFGTARSNVSYDRDSQRFATTRAQRDAEIRAAKALAQEIRSRIVADLAKSRG